jgi:hypothetical protein
MITAAPSVSIPRPIHGSLSALHYQYGRPWRHDVFMAARGWRRLGWVIFAAALAGLAAYMMTVGWSQASLIAEVTGLFIAVIGLAIPLAKRSPKSSEKRVQFKQVMRNVKGAAVDQDAEVNSGYHGLQEMTHARSSDGAVRQRIRFTQPHARDRRRAGSHDV